ncbi:MAG: hypothetical protein LC118_12355 [Dehalococcoidia bacterium]|nr:hypothetical protein [Dehalococcoidia bacterium]
MSEQPEAAAKPRSKLATYGVLGVAVIVALAVGVYVVTSGGDSKTVSPGDDSGGGESLYPNTGPLGPARPKVGEKAPDFALADARDTTKELGLPGRPWWSTVCELVRAMQRSRSSSGAGYPCGRVVFPGVNYRSA